MQKRGKMRCGMARIMRCLLTALLVGGLPGGLVWGGTGAAGPGASGTLSVETDPAGAEVLVDGQRWGTTPVAARALVPGDHRVRVVKDGYLDNARVIRLEAGRGERIQLKLSRYAATTTSQVEAKPQEEKKGSKKKWLFIGLGVAAAGAGTYFLLGGNDPPIAGTIGVSPSATGMAGITSYTFTAQGASDPDGDSLTYEWNLGDGATGSGQSTTHVYSDAGSFSVALTVADKDHKVTAPGTTVTVARSMAGVWAGGVEPGFTNTLFSVNLTQSNTSLGGSMTFSGNLSGTVTGLTGSVGGTTYPASVNFTTVYSVSGIPVRQTFSGSTDSTGSSMTGTATVTLTGATFTATGSSTATGTATLRR